MRKTFCNSSNVNFFTKTGVYHGFSFKIVQFQFAHFHFNFRHRAMEIEYMVFIQIHLWQVSVDRQ